jgi:hypothetical protein
MTLHHVTIETGHSRISTRTEVKNDVIKILKDWIHQALDPHTITVEVPSDASPPYTAMALYTGRSLLIKIINPQNQLILSFIVSDRHDQRAWNLIMPETATVPPTPYCAVTLKPTLDPALSWLGDFERCVAWAWLEMLSEAEAQK